MTGILCLDGRAENLEPGPLGGHGASVHEIGSIGDLSRQVQIVGDKKHGKSLFMLEPFELPEKDGLGRRIDHGRDFVGNE